jgi:hypothetical protein
MSLFIFNDLHCAKSANVQTFAHQYPINFLFSEKGSFLRAGKRRVLRQQNLPGREGP